jgi:hypothetical protein
MVTVRQRVVGLDVSGLSWTFCSIITFTVKASVIITGVATFDGRQTYEITAHFDDFVMELFSIVNFSISEFLFSKFLNIQQLIICPVEFAVSTKRAVKVQTLSFVLNTTVTTYRLLASCYGRVLSPYIVTVV